MTTHKFAQVQYPLIALLEAVESGDLGLPELQRPFVWKRTQVRDLFDSLYRGYPAGQFLFWKTSSQHGAKQIGVDGKQMVPSKVIVDGQQRLTSLYSVIKQRTIVTENFEEQRIRIAFRPRDAAFEVANSATDKDPEWVSDISEVWTAGTYQFINGVLEVLREADRLEPGDEERVANALSLLAQLATYQFTAIELASDLDVDEVSEVFVRVNSKGTSLDQADFILTLMSVYWDEGRRQLETFSRASRIPSMVGSSPFNYLIRPAPDQMLRVSVGLGLRRGRLHAVYQLLRGKQIDSGVESEAIRKAQFDLLREAQSHALDLGNWHEFLKAVLQAGYRKNAMVTSDNNIIYSYLAYLLGRVQFGMTHKELRPLIARWFFMCALTGRYTGTPETQVESDIRRLDESVDAAGFRKTLEAIIETNFTPDFWSVALPDMLVTSSGYTPVLFAYYASLSLLGARVLFSKLTVSELMDPSVQGKKAAIDRHHLFPKAYLKQQGITSVSQINQVANFALVEWPDNVAIGAKAPSEYFPTLFTEQVNPAERDLVRFWHALPEGWQEMTYADFLVERRQLIAKVIKAGYERLATGETPAPPTDQPQLDAPSLKTLLEAHETDRVEYKSSARYSYIDGVPEKVISHAVLKSVAAFLNSDGGTLVIGVADDKTVLGIEADLELKNQDLDSYSNWLTTLILTHLGTVAATNARVRFQPHDAKTVCLVDVQRSPMPVYLTSSGTEELYVRVNNTTRALKLSEIHDYIQQRWEA